jgi:threonine dehydrogenase-like Zn-dependent dehydrogenase
VKAVTLDGPHDVRVHNIPEPGMIDATDAIVRVTHSAICGSDLHPYRGLQPEFEFGTVLGHEFVGEVVEVGTEAASITVGQRVFASDVVACGRCAQCLRGWHYHCDTMSLFGTGGAVGQYTAGGQAEYVRIPNCDLVAAPVPDGVTAEQALFLCDVLPTAYQGVVNSGFAPGDCLVVVGCGPVGLTAVLSGLAQGASRVFAVDPQSARRDRAAALGAVALDTHDELRDEILALSADLGPVNIRVVEAVGATSSLLSAMTLTDPGTFVSAIGVPHATTLTIPALSLFQRESGVRFSVGDPIRSRGELIGLLTSGALDPAPIISDRFGLSQAPDAYTAFDAGEIVKAVLVL